MKKIFTLLAALLVAVSASADEGMWLLPLLKQMNGKALKQAGCRLTPDEIYNINKSSLKDAVVHFGGGCTAEIISQEGLLVTNHHCGYSSIQHLSTPEHNYLMDGYWAKNQAEEIPCPGLSVTFLQQMDDVTDVLAARETAIRKSAPAGAPETFVDSLVQVSRDALKKDIENAHPGCEVRLVNFYNDNYTYAIVSKVYKDVRFVGAPPASMGKFGGETDNWMWPRHTCDFSMFRVYAGEDNEPAPYNPGNRPYRSARSLKISLGGVKEGDFAMVMGYPGRTQRFQTAAQLKQMLADNRISIDARTVRQDIMWEAMCADPSVQLKYANKYASSANGWKKWQGMELAFDKLDIIGRELRKEEAFTAWVNQKPERVAAYGSALKTIEDAVNASASDELAISLLAEAPYRIELVGFAGAFMRGAARGQDVSIEAAAKSLQPMYRDYELPLDKKEAVALLTFFREKAAPADYPKSLGVDFDDFATMDIPAYVEYLFEESAFTTPEKLNALAAANDWEKVWNDPAVRLFQSIQSAITAHYPGYMASMEPLRAGSKAFTAGMLEWEKGKPSYPDANSTMRLTYGHVMPYSPKDAVLMRHYSTINGVLEKEDPSNPEFIVPAKLKELVLAKDFGRWADPSDGLVHTCFLTNNDITGGNSGSPVLNAKGELIGLAFDGNWESMSSDVMFEPDLQRCICVDIRYVLFMVEKFGGADNIIRELTFAK